MTISDERCPTCDGSSVIARNDQRSPCPTCSPAGGIAVPYLAPVDPHESSTLRMVRFAAYLIGVAAIVAALALMIKELWK